MDTKEDAPRRFSPRTGLWLGDWDHTHRESTGGKCTCCWEVERAPVKSADFRRWEARSIPHWWV